MDLINIDTAIKIVLIGDSGVGKTNLLHRYTDQTFLKNTKSTLGVDFISLEQEIDDAKVKIQFWDTAGQENFRAITKTYYKTVPSIRNDYIFLLYDSITFYKFDNLQANGVIMVYDVTNRESFESIPVWLNEVREHGGEDIDIIICGNKIDLLSDRMVSTEEGQDWSYENNVKFFETSAKTNENECVEEAFHELILMVADKVITQAREDFKEEMMRERKTTLRMEKYDEGNKCC